MKIKEITDNRYIVLALHLKTNQLQREHLQSIHYQQVSNTMINFIWCGKTFISMNRAINDIVHLKIQDVVSYLANEAIIQGARMKFDNVENILKGDLYE
ncbi:MAG: post-transcriptional regulator [Breznakia sp.]